MNDRVNAMMAVAAFCRSEGVDGAGADKIWASVLRGDLPESPSDFYALIQSKIGQLRIGTLR